MSAVLDATQLADAGQHELLESHEQLRTLVDQLRVDLGKEQEKADQLERDALRYRYLRELRRADDHLDTRAGWIHVCRSGRFTGNVVTLDGCDKAVDEGMAAQAHHFGDFCHGQEVRP